LRLKNLKKLRTASLNSEFTGSYKKSLKYKRIQTMAEKLSTRETSYSLGLSSRPVHMQIRSFHMGDN